MSRKQATIIRLMSEELEEIKSLYDMAINELNITKEELTNTQMLSKGHFENHQRLKQTFRQLQSRTDTEINKLKSIIKEREAEIMKLDGESAGLEKMLTIIDEHCEETKICHKDNPQDFKVEALKEAYFKEKAKASARNAEKLEFMNQARLYLSGSIEKNALYNTIMKRYKTVMKEDRLTRNY
jgi:hypothetical protein